MITIRLPYPPSVNHYWRRVGGRVLVSKGGRQFRKDVGLILLAAGVRPLEGDLALALDLHPPDKRRRDADNALKALLDALAGHAYRDDNQLSKIIVERHEADASGVGYAMVNVWERAYESP